MVRSVTRSPGPVAAPAVRRSRPREPLLGLAFCAPVLAGGAVFVVFPLFQAVFLATRGTDINGGPTRSVGAANFAELFTPGFGAILLHTLVFTAFVVVVGVVLPMISPSVFFVIVTTTPSALQARGQVQVMTDGGPNGSTSTLVFAILHNAFENGNNDSGLASAQGLVLLLVGIGLTVIQFGMVERRVHYT